jgi:hypothetical protein
MDAPQPSGMSGWGGHRAAGGCCQFRCFKHVCRRSAAAIPGRRSSLRVLASKLLQPGSQATPSHGTTTALPPLTAVGCIAGCALSRGQQALAALSTGRSADVVFEGTDGADKGAAADKVVAWAGRGSEWRRLVTNVMPTSLKA